MSFPYKLLLLSICFWGSLVTSSALAQTVDVVSGISVSATGSSPSVAKSDAFMQARKQAITAIYRQIKGKSPEEITDDLAIKATSFIEVSDEQIAASYYKATLKVGIIREQLFDNITVIKKQDQSQNREDAPQWILVIAVHDIDGKIIYWNDNDPWAAEWNRPRPRQEISLITTTGDSEDRIFFPEKVASAPSPLELEQIAHKYKAPALSVVKVLEDSSTGQQMLETLYWSKTTGLMLKTAPLLTGDIYPEAYQKSVEAMTNFALKQQMPSPFSTAYTSQQTAPSGTPTNLYQNDQTDHPSNSFSQKATIPFSIPIHSLQDWIKIQRKLRAIPELDIDVLSVTKTRVELNLHYPYGAQELTQKINEYGIFDN